MRLSKCRLTAAHSCDGAVLSLTAVCGGGGGGGGGSGKSTLVSAVVGELPPRAGSVAVAAHIGYVQQKAFIISDTVKNNVLLGRACDENRLAVVIEAAEMAADLLLLECGLDTVIGERGATLSGGQQQRLSIARALYGQPELLVLDDPLSAVSLRLEL